MAIAYDATASGSTVFGTSATWSHTCTGSDRVLYVAASAGVTITGITYNGVSLTILAGSGTGAVLARLVAPATGANNVVVSTGSSEEIAGVSASYTGVDQTTPDENTTSATTGDENPTINVTSATGKLVVGMSSYASNAAQSQTPGTGVTERNERDEGFHNVAIGDKAGETTTTFAYTRATGAFYSQLIAATSVNAAGAPVSAAVTGTLRPAVAQDIRDGGKTIILTLTGDTWVASGATFDAQRQAIIDGLDSAQSEGTGWNAEVRDAIAVTTVVRTSDTIVTITLPALADYAITAAETITPTIPGAALTGASPIVADETISVLVGDTLTQPSGTTDENGALASGSFKTDNPGSADTPVTTRRLVKFTPTVGGVACTPRVITVRTP